MNWIFEAYSNVYNAAMMQHNRSQVYAASAKDASVAAPAAMEVPRKRRRVIRAFISAPR